MDEGSDPGATAAVAREMADYRAHGEPEVTDYQIYVGTAAPYNFNGLVRHYFLRRGPNVADVQVNLVVKEERRGPEPRHRQAPACQDPAHRRPPRGAGQGRRGPPGPPVLQTLVAEIYGPDYAQRQRQIARQVRDVFEQTEGVVDVDWYMEEDQPQLIFRFDRRRRPCTESAPSPGGAGPAHRRGGRNVGLLHCRGEVEDVPIRVRLPLGQRAEVCHLLPLPHPRRRWVPGPIGGPGPGRADGRSTTASTARTCSRWSMSPATSAARRRARSTPS